MTPEVSLLAAFVAGILSITSPCVLPLMPLYVAHLAGVSTSSGDDQVMRGRLMSNAAAYVLGFSLVFITAGVAMNAAAGALVDGAELVSGNRYWLIRLGGIFLIALGLYQSGLVRVPWLDRERRLHPTASTQGGLASSFVVGATFGAGWSPCVGPILGAILTLAASQGNAGNAAVLLAIYSAGLAVPFLLVAGFGTRSGILTSLASRSALLATVSGGIMIAMGVLMVLGVYQQVFARIVSMSPWTPWEPAI